MNPCIYGKVLKDRTTKDLWIASLNGIATLEWLEMEHKRNGTRWIIEGGRITDESEEYDWM